LGQAVEPAPDPALRTPLEEHASFGVADDEHRAPPLRPLALRPRRRHARLDPEPASGAALLDRTDRARGTTAHAEHRAEIHDRLRVIGNADLRRVRVGEGPETRLDRALAGPSFDRMVACEHPLHVAVEDRITQPPRLG